MDMNSSFMDRDRRAVWLNIADNDEDLIALSAALTNHSQITKLNLSLPQGFGERSAHLLAACIGRCGIKFIKLETEDDSDVMPAIMEILYLEGNRPMIDHRYSTLCFSFDFLRLKHNAMDLDLYSLNLNHWTTDIVALGSALQNNTALRSLVIFGWRSVRNAEAELRTLAAGIRSSQIKKLSLGWGGDDRGTHYWEVLLRIVFKDSIQASGRLFDLSIRSIPQACVGHLMDILPALEKVSIFNRLSFPMAILREGLARALNLKCLKRDSCELEDEGVKFLSESIHNISSIKQLDLSSNKIGDEGIEALVQNWKEDSNLESVVLRKNNFGPKGVELLMTAVVRHGLKELNISECTSIDYLGLKLIAKQLPNVLLRSLVISGCASFARPVDVSRDAKASREQVLVKTRQCLLDGLRENYTLHHLDAYYNDGITDARRTLEFYESRNKYVYPFLPGNGVAPATWCYILAKLAKLDCYSHSLVFLSFVEQPSLIPKQ